ncbi:transposase family protein [Salmonella enterica]|nr:transposase family protein [Salmonella enterica]EJJ4249149.1 transposase family protein [Salmonella enterica]
MDRERGSWSRKTGLAKKYANFENGIPVNDTIGRVMSNIDSMAFEKCLQTG